jgi:outer membrane protein TolC
VTTATREDEKLRTMREQIRLEYGTARNDLLVAAEKIMVMEQTIEQATENLRINNDRYAEHVGTATEVLDAQTLLSQSRADYYRAIYEYEVALARVKRALGQL